MDYLRTFGTAALLAAVTACSDGASAQKASKPSDGQPVKVVTAIESELRRNVEAVGTLAAQDQTTVSAEVDGRIARIAADMGDPVKSGTPLVVIDNGKYKYAAGEQESQLRQTQARLGANGESLPPEGQTPEVLSAAAKRAQAEQQLERAKSLAAKHLISAQDLEQAQTDLQTAKAAHETAIAAERQLRAELTGKQASLGNARRDLENTVVRAPFEGVVSERLVSPGQFVQVQTPVMRVVRLDPLRLTARIPERFGPGIHVGQAVKVRTDSFPDRQFDGKITRVSPAVDLQSRAFAIEAEIPNHEGAFKPGTFARLEIATDQVDRVLAIPFSAVQTRYGSSQVFVVKDGTLKGSPVKLGDRLGPRVEITEGLKPGSVIVADDVEGLQDGAHVKPVDKASDADGGRPGRKTK